MELSKSGTNLWKTKIISRSTKLGSEWIAARITDYDFVENKDYISFHNFMKRGVGGTTLWKIKTLLSFIKL